MDDRTTSSIPMEPLAPATKNEQTPTTGTSPSDPQLTHGADKEPSSREEQSTASTKAVRPSHNNGRTVEESRPGSGAGGGDGPSNAAAQPPTSDDPDVPVWPHCPDKGPNAEIWKTYVEQTTRTDAEMISRWKDGIGIFLIFTGLFSAILSAFLIYSWTLLGPDNTQATANGIAILSQQLVNISAGHALNPSLAYQQTTFVVPTSAVAVNGLWFTALFISLLAAVVAMLVNEWLSAYDTDPEVVPLKRAEQRQLRYNGLLLWGVPTIITFLPLIIHLALFLLFIGLVILACPVSLVLAYWMGTLLVVGFGAYCASALAPLFYEACPYKSPLYSVLSGLLTVWLKPAIAVVSAVVRPCFAWVIYPILLVGQFFDWIVQSTHLARLYFQYRKDMKGRTQYRQADPESYGPDSVQWTFGTYREMRKWVAGKKNVKVSTHAFRPATSSNQSFKLQAHVLWSLVRSPDQRIQEDAAVFLSWWRMPPNWWTQIREEAQAVVDRIMDAGEAFLETKDAKPGDPENLLLLSLLSSSEPDWGWSHIQIQSAWRDCGAFDEDLAWNMRYSQQLPLNLSRALARETPGEFLISVGLDGLFPAVGDNLERIMTALDSMTSVLTKWSAYPRPVAKYIELLELTLARESFVDAGWIQTLDDWQGRYSVPRGPVLGDSLHSCIKRFLPTSILQLPPSWESKPEAVERIRRALIRCFLDNLDYITGSEISTDFPTSLRHAQLLETWEWFTSLKPSLSRTSEEANTVARLLLAQMGKVDLLYVWSGWQSDFQSCLEYLNDTQELLQCINLWIAGTQNRPYAPNVRLEDGKCITWLLEQQQIDTTIMCIPAILFAHGALHGVHQEKQPVSEADISAAIDLLLTAHWLEYMSSNAIECLSRRWTGISNANLAKLQTMFTRTMKTLLLHRRDEVEGVGSPLLDAYREHFDVDLRTDPAGPRVVE